MLADHCKDTLTISRKVVTGNKTTYAQVATGIAAHIQPLTDTFATAEMGRGIKAYRLFSPSEIRIGDRLVDQNAAAYEVAGVKRHKFRGKQHYEATLRGV